MYNSLYITTTEPHCGKSIVSLGVAHRLLRRTRRLAVFRPIINPGQNNERDKNIDLLLSSNCWDMLWVLSNLLELSFELLLLNLHI